MLVVSNSILSIAMLMASSSRWGSFFDVVDSGLHYTTNIPTDPHTIRTTDIKTNMRHIHTSLLLVPFMKHKLITFCTIDPFTV